MLRCIVPLDSFGDSESFSRLESLIECGTRVGVQVICNKYNLLGLRIVDIDKLLERKSKVDRSASVGNCSLPSSFEGFNPQEDIGRAVTLVFVVDSLMSVRLCGQSPTRSGMEFFGLLVYANNRSLRIIRTLVYREYVLHLCHESGGWFSDAPTAYPPGFQRQLQK